MAPSPVPEPTERELQILRILWQRGEATVREVYEQMRDLGIVQNTVQAFLRTMTDKGLVAFRRRNRTFVYRPLVGAEQTQRRLLKGVLRRAFDGALDQLVANAIAVQAPTSAEIAQLRALLDEVEAGTPAGTRPDGDG
ncbi:MAG: BlaI/MecI/CopY family transcriptional regulator [Planctomycetes bacterium]|nr:BlaI/MecI/CopY family transcriptional regulator [Planctomycetota bacterium]